MNLAEIRNLIATEADLGDFPEHVLDYYINQHLQEFTGKSKYKELYTEETFTTVALEENQFDLPIDFQLFDRIRFHVYNTEPDYDIYLDSWTNKQRPGFTGKTQYYQRLGNTFKVYPYSEVGIGDQFVLSYYKLPTLTEDDDPFPVRSLERAVIEATTARFMRMTDTKKSQLRGIEAERAYLASRSENEGN